MILVPINPATGKRLRSHPATSAAALERLLCAADRARTAWGAAPLPDRAACLEALARELRARRDELADLVAVEMGKPVAQGRAEVEKSAGLCDYYARHGAALLADERPPGAPATARVAFAPLGTVLAIMPWNFPFWQVVRAAVPALIAGNTVLVKPALNVPGCTAALAAAVRRAGFPRGVLQFALVDDRTASALVGDPRVHGVTLTGSTRAGRAVAALAGAALKPGVFELGGSDPALVLADADLDRAAELGAAARLLNSGQSCVCAKRFLVERAVLEEFTARLVARLAARRVGDPRDPATDVGPLARADLRDTLAAQVRRSVRLGARVALGGAARPGPGWFFEPTVLTGVQPGMPAFDEELFGPVAAVVAVRDADDAVRLANRSRYGLGASVYTRDAARGAAVARALEAGSVFINDFVRSSAELPFGGVKDSGYGRELGAWGARAFVNVKTVVAAVG
jgi:succinate-semialdehyde dehydrogenase/glutarate-semialdehyde dehydrogenase